MSSFKHCALNWIYFAHFITFYLFTMIFALKNWFCFHLVITDLSHVPATVCVSSCACTPLPNVPSFHRQSMHQLCLISLLFFVYRLFFCSCFCLCHCSGIGQFYNVQISFKTKFIFPSVKYLISSVLKHVFSTPI